MHIDTQLAHLARDTAPGIQAVNPPLARTSTVVFDTLEAYGEAQRSRVFDGPRRYGRSGTPTTFKLQRTMAALRGAETCITASLAACRPS